MNQELFEWLLLLGRWLHIIVGIAWIGTSIFFMWLDRTIEHNEHNDQAKNPGHMGDLWMVHGGGFYHVEKLQMGPTKVPEVLHWFKWESYWTWLSGIFLLALIFYTGGGIFLLDSTVSHITYWQAVALSVSTLLISWLFYDFVWESHFTRKTPLMGHILTLLWFAGMTYFLCHTLSGRAAYMHIGSMLGTWMTANVFLRIIPRQVKMVEASRQGASVNQEWAKNAKNRSTHNTYFTLPIIFIMVSNHFSSTYGHKLNWLILLLLSGAGAAIREAFIARLKNPSRSQVFAAMGLVLITSAIGVTCAKTGPHTAPQAIDTPASSKAHLVDTAMPTTTTNGAQGHGQIRGVVTFSGAVDSKGNSPHGQKLQLPLACAPAAGGDVYANDILIQNGKIKNVLARITRGLEGKTYHHVPTEPLLPAILDQKNCQYEPRLIAVRVGQPVEFINSDATFHNVKSVTTNNEAFNVAMPSKEDRMTKVFHKPEIFVQTKCSVHPWMSASIAVMDHPFYGITNADGAFEIKDLPVGAYAIEVWHEVFGTQTREIVVKEGETLSVDFSMTLEIGRL